MIVLADTFQKEHGVITVRSRSQTLKAESFGVLENCPLKEIKAEDVETVADALTKIVNQIDFNEIGKVVGKVMNEIAESLKENHLEVKDVTGRSNQGMQED